MCHLLLVFPAISYFTCAFSSAEAFFRESSSNGSIDYLLQRNSRCRGFWRNAKSCVSLTYSNQRDKSLSKLTRLVVNNRKFDARTPKSSATVANQGVFTKLSEQIVTLNERMD